MFDLSVHYADYDDQSSEELTSSAETTTKRGGILTRLTTIMEERDMDYFKELLEFNDDEDEATNSITTDSSTTTDETTVSTAGSVLYLCGAHLFHPRVSLNYGSLFIRLSSHAGPCICIDTGRHVYSVYMFLGSVYGISDIFEENASTLVANSNEDDLKEMFYYDERYELELKMKSFNGTHEIHEVVNKQGDQGAILFNWQTSAPPTDPHAFIQINQHSDPEDVFADVLRPDSAEDYIPSTDSVLDMYANDDPALMSPDTMPIQPMSDDNNLAITVGTVGGMFCGHRLVKDFFFKRGICKEDLSMQVWS